MYPKFDEEDCLHLTEKQSVCPSWPVKVTGMQGLWRYVKPVGDYETGWAFAEVIGPYFPNNPSRNGGRSRIMRVSDLKFAGKRVKPIDVRDVEVEAVSDNAKRARRR